MTTVVAAALLLAIVTYAVLAGADFGAGFWDLFAGDARRGEAPRAVISRAIGPVWEANHVWLIFILVVLWSAFPEAYASIWLTLFVPLTLAALGIVLRGGGFAFRKAVHGAGYRRLFGAIFAVPSIIVPYCMGAVAGAVASGRVPAGGVAGDPVNSWINPTSTISGLLAVAVTAYLASVYLVYDAARLDRDAMVEYFRRRAAAAATVAGIVAAAGIFVFGADATYLYGGLTSRALPVVALSVVAGTTSLLLLMRQSHRGARLSAVVAVGSIIVAWGVAQWDYILPESLTIDQAAASTGTLGALVVAAVLVVVIVGPSFYWLYRLDQRGELPDEGVDETAAAGAATHGIKPTG